MAQQAIGAIRVNLGMNSAEFSRDVKAANRDLARFGRKMADIGKMAAVAFAGVATAAGAAFAKISSHADNMAKTAQQIGVPIEELTALAHAADLSGVSFEKLKTGLGQFSRNLSDTLSGLNTAGVQSLKSLNIALENAQGEMRPTAELLSEVADRFAAMPDGAIKTATAMNLFGRAGRDLIPMLNQGSAGIAQMTNEAERLGLVLNLETAQAAERFNDNMTRVSGVLQGVGQTIFTRVVPTMTRLSDLFVQAATQGGLFDGVINGLTGAFNAMVRAVMFVVRNMQSLLTVVKLFVAVKFLTYLSGVALGMISFARAVRTAGLTLAAFNVVKKTSLLSFAVIATVVAHATGNMQNLTEAMQRVYDQAASLLPQDTFQGMKDLFAPIDDTDFEAWDKIIDNASLAEQGVRKAATAANDLSVGLGAVSTKSTGASKSLKKVKEAAEKIDPVSRTLTNGFSSWIDSAVDGTFRLQDALSDLAKQLQKMLLNRAMQTIFGGSGGSGIFGGLFGGVPAFASGGSMKVGGTGGIDSQLRVIRATPNETIHVTKPGQNIASSSHVHVTVGAATDGNGNIAPFVQSVVRDGIQQAAPGLISSSVQAASGSLASGGFDAAMNGRFNINSKAPAR